MIIQLESLKKRFSDQNEAEIREKEKHLAYMIKAIYDGVET